LWKKIPHFSSLKAQFLQIRLFQAENKLWYGFSPIKGRTERLGGFMKFILFFYLLSLSVITGFVLAEDYITDSDFYQEYMRGKAFELQQEPIHHDDVPTEVMKGFSESAFGDKIISQAYIIPASTSNLIAALVNEKEDPKETYVLTLAADSNQMNTILKFDRKGKLINVFN
jgi:hypothetical protein